MKLSKTPRKSVTYTRFNVTWDAGHIFLVENKEQIGTVERYQDGYRLLMDDGTELFCLNRSIVYSRVTLWLQKKKKDSNG